jgi:uncharacterized phage-associated protein
MDRDFHDRSPQSCKSACKITPVMGPHTFDPEKAMEAILFVANRARGDMYATLKLLYLADKLHLHRYGRFLFGDEHYALPYGPVPQGAYDLVKYVRGTSNEVEYPPAREAFVLEGNTIRTLRDVDRSVFSDSDEECLNEVLDQFGGANFNGLKGATHDEAFHATGRGQRIAPEAIASMADDAAALIQHLADSAPDRK